jgi:hypothetical protein
MLNTRLKFCAACNACSTPRKRPWQATSGTAPRGFSVKQEKRTSHPQPHVQGSLDSTSCGGGGIGLTPNKGKNQGCLPGPQRTTTSTRRETARNARKSTQSLGGHPNKASVKPISEHGAPPTEAVIKSRSSTVAKTATPALQNCEPPCRVWLWYVTPQCRERGMLENGDDGDRWQRAVRKLLVDKPVYFLRCKARWKMPPVANIFRCTSRRCRTAGWVAVGRSIGPAPVGCGAPRSLTSQDM